VASRRKEALVPSKFYLGDGVYIDMDASGVTLTTENGIETTNTIYLEPGVIAKMLGKLALSYPADALKAAIDKGIG